MALTILEGSTFCVCGRARRPRRADRWASSRRHALPLALGAHDQRRAAAPALLRQGRVLLGRLLPAQPDRRRTSATTRSRSRASASSATACRSTSSSRNHSQPARSSSSSRSSSGPTSPTSSRSRTYDFALGDPRTRRPLPPLGRAARTTPRSNQFVLADAERRPGGVTQVVLSAAAARSTARRCAPARARARGESLAAARRRVAVDGRAARAVPPAAERHFGDELQRVRGVARGLAAARAAAARQLGRRSGTPSPARSPISPSLRMRGSGGVGQLPAAGHAVVHDRVRPRHDHHVPADAPLRPRAGAERARRARRAAGDRGRPEHRRRARARSSTRSAHGKAAEAWFPRYYGTVDATPLFLVLLSEVWRWTDDAGLVRELREPALRALRWIDELRRPRRRRLRRVPAALRARAREPVVEGLAPTRSASPTAASRAAPIAPCEVQGYVYDAKLRTAELAREVWRDRELADRLEREAAELRERFDEAFWVEERGGYYALALDGDKRPVDSLCSNIGHLLWSGIVPPERVDAVVDQLMGEELWSGWGVRTMSSGDAGYNPLAYHNGTVWPHDNSLIALGPRALRALARGAADRAAACSRPPRTSTTSCPRSSPASRGPRRRSRSPTRPRRDRRPGRPATPVLLLQLLLGLEPDRRRQHARHGRAGGAALVGGLAPALGRARLRPDLGRARRRRARLVEETEARSRVRVAILSPVWFPVPPTGYGGIEWVVSLLADGLVDAGHDVTLFASGDSRDEGQARVGLRGGAVRADRARSSPSSSHALACYERADEFDVVNDHSGLPAAALGGAVETPSSTPCTGRSTASRARLRADRARLAAASGSSRSR